MYSLPQSYNQTSKCKRCISSNAYDTDLFRIISEFMLVICDLSLQKGIRLSVSDKVDISKSFVDRVMMGNFAPYYYVTRYRQNGGNWEPYLEKYL